MYIYMNCETFMWTLLVWTINIQNYVVLLQTSETRGALKCCFSAQD